LNSEQNGNVRLGRWAECARLDGLIDHAQAGKSAVLVISGKPGVGKIALLRYAIDNAAAAPDHVSFIRCHPDEAVCLSGRASEDARPATLY